MRRVVAGAMVAALVACRGGGHGPPPPAPALLEGVEIAGCGEVVAGPVCRLGHDRALRVWVPAPAGDVGFTSDAGGVEAGPRAKMGDGASFGIVVPGGATRLDVTATFAGRPARFSARVGEVPAPPSWVEDARAKHRAGDAEGALAVLASGERAADARDERVAATVASFRARAVLASGDAARAAPLLAASSQMHEALGELSSAAEDEAARAYVLIEETHAYPEARVSLGRLAALSRAYPEGAAKATFDEGLLALRTGDVRAALAALEAGGAHAERIGDARVARTARQSRALALIGLGRVEEAHAILVALAAEAGGVHPCERAEAHLNLGWARLVARDLALGGEAQAADATGPLRVAEDMYRTTCLDAAARPIALLNLAWGRVQDGDRPAARALIAEARATAAQLEPMTALYATDLEGRLALAGGDARAALRSYVALAARAAGVSRLDEMRAAEGESEAREALGDSPGALEAIQRAEDILDEVARSVPLGEGRGAFWWSRARVTRRRVALLVRLGRAPLALEAARAARRRLHEDVQRASRSPARAPAVAARWEAALARYERGREELSASARDDWTLSESSLAHATTARHTRDVALRAELDAVARDAFPPTPFSPMSLAEGEGVLGLAWVPLEGAWAAFRVEHGAVQVDVVRAPTDLAHLGDATAALLASQSPALRRAKRIRWLAVDDAHEIDLHALSLDGAPLVTRAPVEYVLDASGSAPEPADDGGLVIADPTGSLAAASREGAAFADALGGARPFELLRGERVTHAQVVAETARAAWLLYSGHAAYGGPDGWDSALTLANDERFTVGDVLALPHVPALVILAGCETGRDRARGGPPGLGLADAFIAAGSRAVIASSRPVQDADAELLLRALSLALRAHHDTPVDALREAQSTLARTAPRSDWSAFRAFVR